MYTSTAILSATVLKNSIKTNSHLSTAKHKRPQLAALGQRHPGGQQSAHRRESGALAQAHQHAQHNQRRRAARLNRPRCEQRENRRRQNATAQRPLAAEFLGQQTARQMGGRVAPVERRQNYALQHLRPLVDAFVDEFIVASAAGRHANGMTAALVLHGPLHHLNDGHRQRDAHRVGVHQGEEAHDGQHNALRDDEDCA